MHVENIAVFDSTYESNSFRSVISNADPLVENNLSQIAAVSVICNSATFDVGTGSEEKTTQGKAIVGNATGQIFLSLDFLSVSMNIAYLDVAILRFADMIASAEVTRHRWVNAYRKNFNPKVIKYMRIFWADIVSLTYKFTLVRPST